MIWPPKRPFPRIYPPKPEPLPKGRRMTIAVGVLAKDGVVLAADREETWGLYTKLDRQKVSTVWYMNESGLHVPLAVGAGFSVYIDGFIQYLQRRLREEATRPRADTRLIIEKALKEFYREHVIPFARFPPDERPTLEMIIVQPSQRVRLFQTGYSVVYEPNDIAAIGCGTAVARSVLEPISSVDTQNRPLMDS